MEGLLSMKPNDAKCGTLRGSLICGKCGTAMRVGDQNELTNHGRQGLRGCACPIFNRQQQGYCACPGDRRGASEFFGLEQLHGSGTGDSKECRKLSVGIFQEMSQRHERPPERSCLRNDCFDRCWSICCLRRPNHLFLFRVLPE